RTAPARRQVEAVSDAVGVSRVGGRPIHAYWLLLAPHVRDVLLAPQRHLGDQKLGWSWDPPKDHVNESFSAAECADARQRLAAALERFRHELEESADPVASDERQRLLCQLSSSLDAWAAGLITGSDARVTGYLARTRHGLMFHSWGLAQPAQALAAPSLPGQGDAATAARASHQTTPQRRWRRWMIFLAIIATATLALVGG